MSGIVGVIGNQPVILDIFKSIHSLQPRGTRYASITINEKPKEHFEISKNGPVRALFNGPADLQKLKGTAGIAFVGNGISPDNPHEPNAQPITLTLGNGIPCSVCISGIITNYQTLRKKIEADGAILKTGSYAELVVHLANRSQGSDFVAKTLEALRQIGGSFSLLMMINNQLIAARDYLGNRPLSVGRLPNGGFVFASETYAFNPIGASEIREVEPGEVIVADSEGFSDYLVSASSIKAFCTLEMLNLASPASKMFGRSIFQFRKKLGMEMGPGATFGDCIIPSPKAGQAFVVGMSEVSGLPVVNAIIENGHTFRHLFPDAKSFLDVRFSIIPELLNMDSVILADDIMQSLATARFLTRLLRDSGKVKNIGFRASCPPVNKKLCPYRRSSQIVEETDYDLIKKGDIEEHLGVDNFHYLKIDAIKKVLGPDANQFCFSCFNGT